MNEERRKEEKVKTKQNNNRKFLIFKYIICPNCHLKHNLLLRAFSFPKILLNVPASLQNEDLPILERSFQDVFLAFPQLVPVIAVAFMAQTRTNRYGEQI